MWYSPYPIWYKASTNSNGKWKGSKFGLFLMWILQKVLGLYGIKPLECIQVGSLGPILNKGNVKFIYKEGDSKLINDWRYITLLNVSYKIIAKALILKIRPLLPLIFQPEQIFFIQGRYILDNIIVVWEGME